MQEYDRLRNVQKSLRGMFPGGNQPAPVDTQGWQIRSSTVKVDGFHHVVENGLLNLDLVTGPKVTKMIWPGLLPQMLMPGHGGESAHFTLDYLMGELPAHFYSRQVDVSGLKKEIVEASSIALEFRSGEERQYELAADRDQLHFAMDFATPELTDPVARLKMKGRNPGRNPSAFTLDIKYPESSVDFPDVSLSITNGAFGHLNWNPNLLRMIINMHVYNGHIEDPHLSAIGLAPLVQEEVRATLQKK